jgi:lambda family phage tail tape measure protein
LVPGSPAAKLEEASASKRSTEAAVALAKQKLQAVEQEAEALRKGTVAATALGQQKLKALEDEAKKLRGETSAAVALAKQRFKEQERMIADAWKLSGGPALPPSMQSNQKVFGALGTSFMPVSGNMPKGRSQLQAEETEKAAKEIAAQQIVINKLQNQYALEEAKGVKFAQEKIRLNTILDMLGQKQVTVSKANSVILGENIKELRSMLGLRVLEAKVAGTYQSGSATGGGKKATTAEQLEDRRAKLLERALGVQGTAIALEARGAQISQEKQEIEATILRLKQLQGEASEDELKILLKQIQNLKIASKEISNALPPTQKGRTTDKTPLLERLTGSPRISAAISEGLIGGAFPLLFGQGIGASVGGLAGGAAGGFAGGGLGFGLSLIGTALGATLDTLSQTAQDTGKALNYPIEGFEKLKTAGLFASRQQEYYISKLIETGQTSKATAEIQAEMIKKIGVSGVNDLTELGDSSTRLGKAWAEFNLQLQAALAGPMAGLLDWVASVVELSTGSVQREAQSIDPQAFSRAQEEANRIAQQGKPFFSDQDRTTYEKELNRLSQEIIAKTGVPLIKQTKQDPAQQEAALQAQRQVADEIKSAYREGFQIQQRAIDLERKTADIRRRIENEIFNKQQELLQRQADNDRKRAQVAIEAVDLEYRKRIANEEGRAAEVLAAEAELFKTRAQGEAEIATAKKLLELDISKRQREAQDYVYNLSREADSIRRETLSFEMEVADYRLEIERKIENERLIAAAAEKAKGGATAFAVGGAFDTGLRTGPSSVIGGSAPYHQDISFGPNVGLEQQRQLMVALAKAYDDMGRKIELSNEAVKGRIFPLKGSAAEQNKFITDALAAHRSRGGGTGRSAIDFYAPTKGENRFGKSVENVAMYAPIVPGANLSYGRGGGAGASITATQNGQKIFELMHGRTDRALPGMSKMPGSAAAAAPASATAAPTSTAAQLEKARSQADRRPVITPVPVGMAAGAMAALNAQDTKIKQEAITLDQRLAQLQEEKARQRLYEVARGPIEIKQRQEVVNLAKAELAAIEPMSQNRQEAVLFETQASEILKNRQTTDNEILRITKLQGEEKKKLEQALADGLVNTQKQIELDREALKLAQERRFIEERAGLSQQLAVTGAAEQAGFFGAGASAYTSELARSGDAAQATEIAQQTRALEVKQAIASIRGELNSLIDSTNIGIKAAEGIGNAFGQAFQGLISGSMSAQEALASFFKSTAEAFLDMATQIIAKQMTMIVLQTILKALGAVAGSFSGGTSSAVPTDAGGWANSFATPLQGLGSIGPIGFAKGGAFANSIVSSPTLFQFADGGVTKMGEMGEAGPEAIMPLKRGPDGRLGVDASGMAAPYQRSAAAATTPEMEVPYQRSGPGLAVPYLKSADDAAGDSMNATIDVKFETVRIGGVDYVTRDEAEQIGRESAQRGADLAHKRYRNSPSARRAAGLS